MKSTLAFIILTCQIASGGTRHVTPSFSVVGAVGQSSSNWQRWPFGGIVSQGSSEGKPVHLGLALSGGVQYGPVFELQGIHFLISLESGYTGLSPSQLVTSSFTLDGGLRRMPLAARYLIQCWSGGTALLGETSCVIGSRLNLETSEFTI